MQLMGGRPLNPFASVLNSTLPLNTQHHCAARFGCCMLKRLNRED